MKTKHPELDKVMKKQGKGKALEDHVAEYDKLAAEYKTKLDSRDILANYKYIIGYVMALYEFGIISSNQYYDCLDENDELMNECFNIGKL